MSDIQSQIYEDRELASYSSFREQNSDLQPIEKEIAWLESKGCCTTYMTPAGLRIRGIFPQRYQVFMSILSKWHWKNRKKLSTPNTVA